MQGDWKKEKGALQHSIKRHEILQKIVFSLFTGGTVIWVGFGTV